MISITRLYSNSGVSKNHRVDRRPWMRQCRPHEGRDQRSTVVFTPEKEQVHIKRSRRDWECRPDITEKQAEITWLKTNKHKNNVQSILYPWQLRKKNEKSVDLADQLKRRSWHQVRVGSAKWVMLRFWLLMAPRKKDTPGELWFAHACPRTEQAMLNYLPPSQSPSLPTSAPYI